jgi:hypothetical protein
MTGHPRRSDRWIAILVLLATIAMAVPLVQWADRQFLRVEPPPMVRRRRTVSRPDWVFACEHPYRRMQHDWLWFGVAATVGAGVLLATDRRTWTRRRLARPGTTGVLVMLLLGGVLAIQQVLVPPPFGRSNGLNYDLRNALEIPLSGAILGVWVVRWLRPARSRPDRRELTARFVGWMWMANIALLIGYGLLFG